MLLSFEDKISGITKHKKKFLVKIEFNHHLSLQFCDSANDVACVLYKQENKIFLKNFEIYFYLSLKVGSNFYKFKPILILTVCY